MAAAVVLEVPVKAESLVDYRIYIGQMWPDEGCNLAPSCLSCPFVKCRHDYFGGELQLRSEERRRQVAEMKARGLTFREMAAELGVSVRQVARLAAMS